MSRPRSFQTIRRIVTMFIMCGLVLLGAWITRRTRLVHGPYWGGIVTSLLNLIIPQIVYPLLLIERHSAEGNSQKSLYTKIIIFRWFNTVILLKFLNDYNRTLSDGNHDLLKSVSGIFVSEIIFTPIICLLDIGGTLSKHYFAPRAKTQQQMYLCFKGTPYNLAEKYTVSSVWPLYPWGMNLLMVDSFGNPIYNILLKSSLCTCTIHNFLRTWQELCSSATSTVHFSQLPFFSEVWHCLFVIMLINIVL